MKFTYAKEITMKLFRNLSFLLLAPHQNLHSVIKFLCEIRPTMDTQSKHSTLGAEIKEARNQKGWSQLRLATEAHVSTRTIVALETDGESRPRMDVIVRLARALGGDIEGWLALAGYRNLAKGKVESALRAAGTFRFEGEVDPADFFSRLVEELSNHTPRLICVCYPSVPGTTHRPDVRNLLVTALKNGLSLALICPYSNAGDSIAKTTKPCLVRNYREVYDHVVLLARDLGGRLTTRQRQRLAVFVPQQTSGWTMPPMGISKVRQALIKRFTDGENEDSDYQLVAWVELIQDQKDRMIEIYPTSEVTRSRIDVLRCWREYFSEIIESCDAQKGWSQLRRLTDWKLITLK
jgi:transcriptional regulator with XRE-family HTH domain